MSSLVFAGAGHVFPEQVRRFNTLRPARWAYLTEFPPATSGNDINVVSWTSAHYLKDWLVFNLLAQGGGGPGTDTDTGDFGAFTTAPDGTTDTARLLKETNSNSEHSFIAGMDYVGQDHFGKVRLSGVFKYAGRRIILTITKTPVIAAGSTFGCKAVFDLLNGQVAVDTVFFGTVPDTPWTVYPAQIQAIGNGWYHCWIEAIANTTALGAPGGALFGKLSLDNGTGTMAERSTYIGDTVSGVYGWRSNLLPSRAWDLSETVFFDDFDDPTMANIDLTNSRASGFTWYIENDAPVFDTDVNDGNPATDPTLLSVTGSVLSGEHPYPLFLSTCASLWDRPATTVPMDSPERLAAYTNEYVGSGWLLPALFEGRAKWALADTGTMWTVGLEGMMGGRSQDLAGVLPSYEIDWFEGFGGSKPTCHVIYYPPGPTANFDANLGQVGGGNNSYSTLDPWQPFPPASYGIGGHVERLGTNYTSLTALNRNNPPESSPANWGPYAPTGIGATPPANNWNEFHTYSVMHFPRTEEEPGQIYCFYDEEFASIPLVYGPDLPVDNIHQSDWQQHPLMLGCGGGAGHPLYTDWVRVIK